MMPRLLHSQTTICPKKFTRTSTKPLLYITDTEHPMKEKPYTVPQEMHGRGKGTNNTSAIAMGRVGWGVGGIQKVSGERNPFKKNLIDISVKIFEGKSDQIGWWGQSYIWL